MSIERVPIKGGGNHPPEASLKLNGPPGTGKTTQLLERLTRLMDGGTEPADVAFVTYRKEMAEEFLRRLESRGYITKNEWYNPWEEDTEHFGTIHAVCKRLLGDGKVVEEDARREFMYEEYSARYDGRGENWDYDPSRADPIGTLLFDAYSWCVENKQHSFTRAPNYKRIKDKAVSPPSFEEFSQAWQSFLLDYPDDPDERGIDFASMLKEVDDRGLAPTGDVLIVDEYHDMTPIMASICEMWMDRFDTVIVGGDPLQAIYTYKGADPSFFTDLDLPEVVLDHTYRVPENVWEYAKNVIDHETPEVVPDSSGGTVRAVQGEPTRVIEKYGEDSTMFLARTQNQLHEIASKLKRAGIIYRSQDSIGGWNQSDTLLALFNTLQKLEDVRPVDHVNPNTGQTGMARFEQDEIEEDFRQPENVELDADTARRFISLTPATYISGTKKGLKERLKQLDEVTGSDLLADVEPSFWSDMTNAASSVDNLLKYGSKETLKRALERYDEPIEDISVAPVPDVLTIHASKGKEAETVALYDGIPNAVQENIRSDVAEARAESRVWYVAATRTADTLLLFPYEFDDYTERFLPYGPVN
jgi:DNA helicase-2/ATP-dependent DNA helicase PcrA